MSPCTKGIFDPINWFIIPERGELCIIGELRSGCMEPDWCLFPADSNSYTMTIAAIETLEIAGDDKSYTLLIIRDDVPSSLEDKFKQIMSGELLTISKTRG